MSYSNYKKAVKIINENKHKCDFIGKRSENLIQKAEDILGLKFSKTYRSFIKDFGAGNYGSQEFLGVIHDDFENVLVPDGIGYTLNDRK